MIEYPSVTPRLISARYRFCGFPALLRLGLPSATRGTIDHILGIVPDFTGRIRIYVALHA